MVHDARDLVLVAELPGGSHPLMKRSRRHRQHARRRHADVSRARDVIVGVHCAQGGVDRAHEARLVDLRSEEHTSELQSQSNLVCRLLLEKKKKKKKDKERKKMIN